MLHVLHVIGQMGYGGAETLIMNWYRQLDRTKIQFDFVENDEGRAAYDDEIEHLGGRIFHCPRFRGYNLIQYLWWWYKFLRKHSREYIAVHGHIGSTAAMYLAMAKHYGIFTIAHSHSTDGKLNFKSFLYKVLAYPTRYIADYFFGCSKEAILNRYGRWVYDNKNISSVLNNAIDVQKFAYAPSVREELRCNLGIGDDEVVIGHVGRFVEVKNHQFLLQIFAKIVAKHPSARLLLVGDGALRQQIVEQAGALGIFDKIIMTGVRDDVYNWYQAMDVFVFPSSYEGFGIVALEAQVSGLPCILSDNIPHEIDVTDLVTHVSLQDSAEAWTEVILSKMDLPRQGRQEEIQNAGFDARAAVRRLEDFYIGIADNVVK